ncbi:MAG TPA: citrate synthase [Terriglobales bacterium]|nr:citrate synthase [Terriglobales bacterium]
MSTENPTATTRGLEDVVASPSSICYIDGNLGILAYRGYDIHDLAERSSFEETAYLLWFGRLPTAGELQALKQQLQEFSPLPEAASQLLADFHARAPQALPMDTLRTAVSALGLIDPDARDMAREANVRKSIRLLAQTSTLVAALDRVRKGKAPVAPARDLSLAGNFLYMLTGNRPSATAERAFDIALILHADHEFNASTFAARVTAATLSDIHSAVTSAIGALKGPLHGGANEAVINLLLKVGANDPIAYVKDLIAKKVKIPGFGHRVYHTEDPRATHLRQMSRDLCQAAGLNQLYEHSHQIEAYIKAEKKLNPNVDFYSASAYYAMGISPDLYTPIFAVSRMSGWTAHVLEQYADNRLIRPRAEYIGPQVPQSYLPIAQR